MASREFLQILITVLDTCTGDLQTLTRHRVNKQTIGVGNNKLHFTHRST